MADLYPKLPKEVLNNSDVDVTENESDNEEKAPVISPSKRAGINRDKRNILVEPLQKKSDKKQAESEKVVSNVSLLFFFAIFVSILAVGGYFYWPNTIPQEDDIQGLDLDKVRHDFEASLRNLRSVFKIQTKETWVRIQTIVRMTTAHPQPQSPGVISLIPSESAAETVHCLAKKLAENLSLAYRDHKMVSIDGNSFGSGGNVDQIKHDLDREIKEGLNDTHVVLLLNLDKIPARSGMLLHGLCDNDNAPFKQAVFILMVSGNNHPNVSNGGINAEVTAAWSKDLPEEERMSLESRIGNGIAVVLPESKETLAEIC